jgi:quinol monooxygenase YgiN
MRIAVDATRRRLLATAGCLVAATSAVAQVPGPAAASSSSVYVVTYIEVGAASVRAGAALMRRYAHETHAEAGNLAVDALQEIGRGNRFVVIERWRDQASSTAHQMAPHTAEFTHQLKLIQRGPSDERITHGFAIDAHEPTPALKGVYSVTHVDVPGSKGPDAEVLLRSFAGQARAAPGNQRYDVYQQDAPRLNHFEVFAIWRNRAASEAFEDSGASLNFREALSPLLGALYDERLYRTITPQ